MVSEPDRARPCTQCGRRPHETSFPERGQLCLDCRRSYGRRHYAQNRDYYLQKARRRNARTTAHVRIWLLEYLTRHACVDCGTTDVRVLEFDHRDRSRKRAAVSVLASNGYSLEAVQREVEECDVRCANCHTIRTREQRGW